ncbi:hypothetical protein B0H19DRAFT_1241880 [Mycena capillaripes]|nr:hypothetical protein B0H19DRAFT_1241880 [Mycena capillaripes]
MENPEQARADLDIEQEFGRGRDKAEGREEVGSGRSVDVVMVGGKKDQHGRPSLDADSLIKRCTTWELTSAASLHSGDQLGGRSERLNSGDLASPITFGAVIRKTQKIQKATRKELVKLLMYIELFWDYRVLAPNYSVLYFEGVAMLLQELPQLRRVQLFAELRAWRFFSTFDAFSRDLLSSAQFSTDSLGSMLILFAL